MNKDVPILIKNPWPVTDEHSHWQVVSRDAILKTISELIKDGQYRCVHLSGPPGIGKTFVGFFYGYSREAERWSRVRRNKDVLKAPLNPNELHVQVLDGVDETEDSFVLMQQIDVYLRKHSNARVIFTARDDFQIPDSLSALTCQLRVPPFQNVETHAFLGQLGLKDLTAARMDILHEQLEGNPALLFQLAEILYSGKASVQEIVDQLNLYYWPGLVDASGTPISKGSSADRRVIHLVQTINEEVLSRLAADPRLVHELSPRNFEALIAELLVRQGYYVQVTPTTRDGGKDIYAVAKSSVGSFLYVVECKKYAPGRPVGVALVRNLYGVVQAERASAGIL